MGQKINSKPFPDFKVIEDGVILKNLDLFHDDIQERTNALDQITNGFEAVTGSASPTIIDTVSAQTDITTTGASQAFTLADGVIGPSKRIQLVVDGGDAIITPANFKDGTTMTINTAGGFVEMFFSVVGGWTITVNGGVVVA